MTTIAKAKAEILDRIPADRRAEYQDLQREIRAIERQEKTLANQRKNLQARVSAIMTAAAQEITSDRDLAIMRHSSTAAYSRFSDAVTALHSRVHNTNYSLDDAPKGSAPFLGAEVRLYPRYDQVLTVDDAPEIAAALVTYAQNFVGDDIADFGDHAGLIWAQIATGSDSRFRGMSLFYSPDGERAALYIVDYDGDETPVEANLSTVLTVAIERSLAWAKSDEDEGDDR